jgi:hypothetical protein
MRSGLHGRLVSPARERHVGHRPPGRGGDYVYTPAGGYVITGNLNLDDCMFCVPRPIQYVKLGDNAGEKCKS